MVTEAGFGADLGGEKFFDIKCRSAGLKPSCAVVVATVRALKMHGGVARNALGPENVEAVEARHRQPARATSRTWQSSACRSWSAVNHFTSDTEAEFAAIRDGMAALGVEAISCTHWAHGGAGAEELARAVHAAGSSSGKARLQAAVSAGADARRQDPHDRDGDLPRRRHRRCRTRWRGGWRRSRMPGFGDVPVCIAKTQYSFTADPTVMGAPTGHIAAGARGAPVRRRRVRGGDLRRHHDHAGPAARAGRRGDPSA